MNRGSVDVWRIGLARPASEVSALQELLDASERGRANMFRAERDKRRFVVARATLRMVLARYAGIEPHRVRINVRPGGKPVLARNSVSGALHFNLSHSGELALCAVADREVGVDLEQVKQHDDMERVAQHFFSRVEARELGALSGIDRTHYFFRTWVRKEAYLKACGEGLARDTTRFTVREPAAGITLHTPDGYWVDDSYSIYDLPDVDNHFAAVALAAVGSAPAIRYRDWPTAITDNNRQ
jgi:4'-phosphopantetheinyl transferase